MISISVVIIAFNEEGNIENVAIQTNNALKSFTEDYEIILVNDGSTDTTSQKIF